MHDKPIWWEVRDRTLRTAKLKHSFYGQEKKCKPSK